MKRVIVMAALWLLASCADDAIIPTFESFRERGAQIASQTNVTAERMAGEWYVRQGFANQPAPNGRIQFSAGANDRLLAVYSREVCESQGCQYIEYERIYEPSGLGRWTEAQSDSPSLFDSDLWVMWMDFDSRTAAIGNASGHIGWIMDKNPTGGRDRITAARDIMDWFGYNVSRLEEVNR